MATIEGVNQHKGSLVSRLAMKSSSHHYEYESVLNRFVLHIPQCGGQVSSIFGSLPGSDRFWEPNNHKLWFSIDWSEVNK